MKPSRGRISSAPQGEGPFPLAQSGPIAWTVRDAAAFLDVVGGLRARRPGPPRRARPAVRHSCRNPPAGRCRIAVTVEPPLDHAVDAQCAAAALDAARLLADLGHDVVEATPPWREDGLLDRFGLLWRMGPALYRVPPAQLEPLNRVLAEAAHATPALEYVGAVLELQRYARRVSSFWDDVDVVLTPTLAKLPVAIGWVLEPEDPWEQYRRAAAFTPFTAVANVTGQPAASVPFGLADGLPVGVQLIARVGEEETLIRLAAQIEQARPWAGRRPPVSAGGTTSDQRASGGSLAPLRYGDCGTHERASA